jgi:hypothetical protein
MWRQLARRARLEPRGSHSFIFYKDSLFGKIGSSNSPIVVQVAGEGAVWMSVLWHWTTDIWLWILLLLSKSPVIVEVAGESGVRVGILWHWTSDIGLWILFQLSMGPVVVEVAGESAIWMGILWHWSPDIW